MNRPPSAAAGTILISVSLKQWKEIQDEAAAALAKIDVLKAEQKSAEHFYAGRFAATAKEYIAFRRDRG
jgi:hypothetical protein